MKMYQGKLTVCLKTLRLLSSLLIVAKRLGQKPEP